MKTNRMEKNGEWRDGSVQWGSRHGIYIMLWGSNENHQKMTNNEEQTIEPRMREDPQRRMTENEEEIDGCRERTTKGRQNKKRRRRKW